VKVVWLPLAIDRVYEIAEYIALDNPVAAANWVEDIFAKVKPLAEFPEIGRIVPELGRGDIKELIFGNYRIIYRVSASIAVLTVRHSKQLLLDSDLEEG